MPVSAMRCCGVFLAFLVGFVIVASRLALAWAEPLPLAGGCQIEAVGFLPDAVLCEAAGEGSMAVPLGGLSDLILDVDEAGVVRFKAITDRGPNGKVATPAGKQRTLLNPAFVPTVVTFELGDVDAAEPWVTSPEGAAAKLSVSLVGMQALRGRTGVALSGRPNGIGNDEPILTADGTSPIEPDPNGFDTEGLVQLPDGSYWISEEYRPSLAWMTAEGQVQGRLTPAGQVLEGADMESLDVLPAAYGDRQDNRGFESLAVSKDGRTVWVMLQSPLDHPHAAAAAATGNVRMLAIDVATKKPVGEYVYRAGRPTAEGWARTGAPPEDVKLCAMSALDDGRLLVLEQSDGGVAELYLVSFEAATNLLDAALAEPIEPVGDLSAAGVAMLGKTLVADLAPHLSAMADHVTDGQWRKSGDEPPGLKLEGLAILDPHRVAIVNDNDFNIDWIEDHDEPQRRNCLWVIQLHDPLPAFP
jgi:hypothetical protein